MSPVASLINHDGHTPQEKVYRHFHFRSNDHSSTVNTTDNFIYESPFCLEQYEARFPKSHLRLSKFKFFTIYYYAKI